MIGWWILGIRLLVILLLCLTRVGVLIRFGEELTVSAQFGFLKFQVLPEKKKQAPVGKDESNGHGK